MLRGAIFGNAQISAQENVLRSLYFLKAKALDWSIALLENNNIVCKRTNGQGSLE
jgi:hypothetical protein